MSSVYTCDKALFSNLSVRKMVSTLMQSCREQDEVMRALVGECLGAMGAVDPGRLHIVNRFQGKHKISMQ